MHTDISITKAVEGYIVSVQRTLDPINGRLNRSQQHVFLSLEEVKTFIASELDVSETQAKEDAPNTNE